MNKTIKAAFFVLAGFILEILQNAIGTLFFEEYIKNKSWETYWSAFLARTSLEGTLANVLILTFVVWAIWAIRKYKTLLNRLGYADSLGLKNAAGINSERSRIWQTRFKSSNNIDKLDILGATGFNTFAKKEQENHLNAPLLNTIQGFPQNKPIRVLLLDPRSKYFSIRVNDLNKVDPHINLKTYFEETRRAVDFCHSQASEHKKNIRWRFYDRPPIWKLIITNDVVWQQLYVEKCHVERTPVNIFLRPTEPSNYLQGLIDPSRKIDTESNFYDAFNKIFDGLWDQFQKTENQIPQFSWISNGNSPS